MRISRISRAGRVEMLPMRWSCQTFNSLVISPDEDALYLGTRDGSLLVQHAPWRDAPPDVLLSGLGSVSQLRLCSGG
jgi:hypothetical protein